MCGRPIDADLFDLLLNGWEKVQGQDEICGPEIMDGEILALWQEYDIASDLMELIGLIFGEGAKEIIQRFALKGNLAEATIHVREPRLRKADVWLTITDDDDAFEGVFVRTDGFVSPEVLEMIEVAAVGDES